MQQADDHSALDVVRKFETSWKTGPQQQPTVVAVLTITNMDVEQNWERYKKRLAEKAVERYFFGTVLNCNLLCNKALCQAASCMICRIANGGFTPVQTGGTTRQRFGIFFCLAQNSSTSNDYARDYQHEGVLLRAQLLCDVCTGKKYTLRDSDHGQKRPPPGFDSLQIGKDNNYKIVVYDQAAIMPRYIILYDIRPR